MKTWELVDYFDAAEEVEEFPRNEIRSEQELREGLSAMRQREPGAVFLASPGGDALKLVLGGSWGGLRWMRPPSASKIAVTSARVTATPLPFSDEGVTNLLSPEEAFPAEEVIEAAVCFFREHRLPEWITWRQWNPTTKQWDTILATRPAPAGVLAK